MRLGATTHELAATVSLRAAIHQMSATHRLGAAASLRAATYGLASAMGAAAHGLASSTSRMCAAARGLASSTSRLGAAARGLLATTGLDTGGRQRAHKSDRDAPSVHHNVAMADHGDGGRPEERIPTARAGMSAMDCHPADMHGPATGACQRHAPSPARNDEVDPISAQVTARDRDAPSSIVHEDVAVAVDDAGHGTRPRERAAGAPPGAAALPAPLPPFTTTLPPLMTVAARRGPPRGRTG